MCARKTEELRNQTLMNMVIVKHLKTSSERYWHSNLPKQSVYNEQAETFWENVKFSKRSDEKLVTIDAAEICSRLLINFELQSRCSCCNAQHHIVWLTNIE